MPIETDSPASTLLFGSLALLLLRNVFGPMALGALLALLRIYRPPVIQFVLRHVVVRFLLPLLVLEKVVSQLNLSDGLGMLFAFLAAIATIATATAIARLVARLPVIRRDLADSDRVGGQTAAHQDATSADTTPADTTSGGTTSGGTTSGGATSGGATSAGAHSLPGRGRRSFVLALSFHNYAFIVYPLVLALLGPRALSLAFVFALTCDALFWSFGVTIIDSSAKVRWREVINPPFVALLVATLLAFAGAGRAVGPSVFAWVAKVSWLAIPIALTTVGGVFFHALRALDWSHLPWRPLVVALVIRVVVLPGILVSVVVFLFEPSMLRSVLLIEAIMPASIGVVLLSALYHGNHTLIASFSTLSNALGVVSIPLWLRLLF